MKFFILAICFISIQVSAQASNDSGTETCTPKCVEKEAIPVMKKAVLAAAPPVGQASDCPASGSELIKDVQTDVGKAMTSKKIILEMVNQTAATRVKYEKDASRCGACKQVNLVSTYTTSSPNQPKPDQVCATPFARNFQHEMNNQDIEAFANDTLRGKNAEGQKFGVDCSNTCNMYTASAETPLTPTTSRLNLTILCGPPRVGTVVFATYDLSVGFIHQWVCTK